MNSDGCEGEPIKVKVFRMDPVWSLVRHGVGLVSCKSTAIAVIRGRSFGDDPGFEANPVFETSSLSS